MSYEQILAIAEDHQAYPESRRAHQQLADAITLLVHGDEALAAAQRITQAIFSNQILGLSLSDFEQLAQDGLPTFEISQTGMLLTEALFESGLSVTPKGEVTRGQAKKLVLGNAISVNGQKQTSTDFSLEQKDALFGRFHLIQKGKKQHFLISHQ